MSFKHGGHLVFQPSHVQLVPRPSTGTYFTPDGNGVVPTWARQEAFAQIMNWAGAAKDRVWYAHRFIGNIAAQVGDQITDVFTATGITPTSEQAASVNIACAPEDFGEGGILLAAVNASSQAVPGWRWDGSKCRIADNTLLTAGYYVEFQYDLNKGGYTN